MNSIEILFVTVNPKSVARRFRFLNEIPLPIAQFRLLRPSVSLQIVLQDGMLDVIEILANFVKSILNARLVKMIHGKGEIGGERE